MAMRGDPLPGPRAIPQPPCGGSLRAVAAGKRRGAPKPTKRKSDASRSQRRPQDLADCRRERPSYAMTGSAPKQNISMSKSYSHVG